MKWKYAIGNSNNRYQHMVVKSGQGLAGAALRLGRWVKLDDTHPKLVQERRECPVMLAEQLQAAAVFPLVINDTSLMSGLLYIGKRTAIGYEEDEIRAAQESLRALMSSMAEHNKEMTK
ncbi:GAF domain-containing protein [Paenibacillus sp. NEAU-GSW1]|uniref:GAF domain-containing protein n=1 Tax=Paenibacillus sp. NEAU-GSW1 TaxID=2682486 RepID=UPI001C12C219|nr:GAF domain-containing protein [Paenibacillus sp. NEAU-GSW1]